MCTRGGPQPGGQVNETPEYRPLLVELRHGIAEASSGDNAVRAITDLLGRKREDV